MLNANRLRGSGRIFLTLIIPISFLLFFDSCIEKQGDDVPPGRENHIRIIAVDLFYDHPVQSLTISGYDKKSLYIRSHKTNSSPEHFGQNIKLEFFENQIHAISEKNDVLFASGFDIVDVAGEKVIDRFKITSDIGRNLVLRGSLTINSDDVGIFLSAGIYENDLIAYMMTESVQRNDPEAYKEMMAILYRSNIFVHSGQLSGDGRLTESERYGLYFDEKHPEKHHYEAVYATGGMVAHFNKQPVVLFTSEICGGMTATPDMVWHDVHPQPYYQIVICEYCLGSKPFEWTNAIRSEALGEALFDHRDAVSVWISQYYENGRPKFITAQMNRQKKTFTVEEFRHRLAVQYESRIILSDWFEISDLNFFPETNAGPHSIRISQTIVSSEPDIVYFKGWGKGHGIGICQEASRRQARSGKNTSEILHYYYPRVNTRMIDSEE